MMRAELREYIEDKRRRPDFSVLDSAVLTILDILFTK